MQMQPIVASGPVCVVLDDSDHPVVCPQILMYITILCRTGLSEPTLGPDLPSRPEIPSLKIVPHSAFGDKSESMNYPPRHHAPYMGPSKSVSARPSPVSEPKAFTGLMPVKNDKAEAKVSP